MQLFSLRKFELCDVPKFSSLVFILKLKILKTFFRLQNLKAVVPLSKVGNSQGIKIFDFGNKNPRKF